MKNTLVYYDPDFTVRIEDVPIPEYGDDEVLIKVVCAGSNPKDWKHPMPNRFNVRVNQGDDASGIVQAVGSNVEHIQPGDRVAAFHTMDTPRGTYAEYTVCHSNTVFQIPPTLSFEEAATIPLAAYTAAVGLYLNLELPLPKGTNEHSPPRQNSSGLPQIPLIVNGAASAVGAFAVKLARMNPRIGPIIGTASPGRSTDFARSAGCDVVVSYRNPWETVSTDLHRALGGREVHHVFDAANDINSVRYLSSCFLRGEDNRYTSTLPVNASARDADVHPGVEQMDRLLRDVTAWHEQIWVGFVHEDEVPEAKKFGYMASRIFEQGLRDGRFSGHPYEVVPNGLEGVYAGLVRLRDRTRGNEKFVYRIAETPGL